MGLTTPYLCPTLEPAPGFGLPLDDPVGLNATYVTNVNQGLYCNSATYREAGGLVGTAYTARDLMTIASSLGEDGMVRYWGSSYGTLLGATVAAMFPDKIDRMVLDGNINPTDYYHGLNEESVDDVDAAVENFFNACAYAGSEYCILADDVSTGAELQDTYLSWLEGYKNGSYVITDTYGYEYSYSAVKGVLFSGLKAPGDFPDLAATISVYYDAVSSSSGYSRVLRRQAPFDPLDATGQEGYEVLSAITCGDWDDIPGNGTLEDFADWLKLYEDRSSFGGDQLISILYGCSTWKVNAKEKYGGSFEDIETAKPILFINGHLDPVTPLVSAQNSSSGFKGSGVLQTNIAGHCSTAMASQCVNDKIFSYFDTGVLPDLDEICDPDTPAFLPIGSVIRNITDSDTDSTGTDYRKRWEHKPNFEYPEALRHARRDVYTALLERRQESGLPNCTSLATWATTSDTDESSSAGTVSAQTNSILLCLLAVAGVMTTML